MVARGGAGTPRPGSQRQIEGSKMAKRPQIIKPRIPIIKIVAAVLGFVFAGVEIWLNTEFLAKQEGLVSPVTATVVVASIGAAVFIPIAEAAAKAGQWFKALGFGVVFICMAAYALSASVERIGSHRDANIGAAQADNARAGLAKEAYEEAVKIASRECTKPGARCRAAEEAVKQARERLLQKPVQSVIDSLGTRITAVLPFLTPEQVRLYQPLTLPIGLQFGGYLLLAFGFAPGGEARQPRRNKGNRKRKPKKALAPRTVSTANVVTFPPSAKQS
jgi:hypothetical protein